MGIVLMLTIIFVLLKCTGFVLWPWWIVFAPVLVPLTIAVVLWLTAITVTIVSYVSAKKKK